MSQQKPQVLFISADRIGDAIMSIGAIREIGRQIPDAEITVAVGPTAAALFRAAPQVVKVIPWKKQKLSGHWRTLWKQAVGTHWAMVADVRGSVMSFFLKADTRRLYSRKLEKGEMKVVTFSNMMKAAKTAEPEIFLDDKARADAAAIIGDDLSPILAVAPISTATDRSWPAERWAELTQKLMLEPRFDGWRFMPVGGSGDHAAAAPALAVAGDRSIDAVGKCDILGSAALLQRATLFVGNDSGLMHVSAAAGTPTLGLFGPSEWWHKAPYGSKGVVLAAAKQRGQFAPITDLSVEEVFAATLSLYDTYAAPRG